MSVNLGEYLSTPLYNIKAVVQATEISPSTLRAWERRYNVCRPERSDSGYRLYSDRDVAIIRWLKMQVDAGMSISQAVAWYESIVAESESLDEVVLPGAPRSTPSAIGSNNTVGQSTINASAPVRSLEALQQDLLNALLDYDEWRAEQIVSEAFAMYTFEQIGEELITEVLKEVGDLWHKGQLSVSHEHYASSYLKHRLSAMLRTIPHNSRPTPLVWVGCAPGEQHEIGAMLLSIYMRRAGYQVRYFGQNLLSEDFVAEVAKYTPQMVLFSASTEETAAELKHLAAELVALNQERLLIGYGGRIFNEVSDLRQEVPGVFLGDTAKDAVEIVDELLRKELQSAA